MLIAKKYKKDATSVRQMRLIASEILCDLIEEDSRIWIEFCDGSILMYNVISDKASVLVPYTKE